MSSRFKYTPLALSLLALHMPALAEETGTPATPSPLAAPASAEAPAQELGEITVKARAENAYKVEKAASPKYTAPLRDTPQTVQVVPKRVIEEQGQLTLRDMLSNVPGITFGAAEGGNGFGDNITLRGVSISNDIQLDGIRDSAQTARVDPFNLEQLEVVKGASSVYSGGGAVAGTVNMVSKTAQADDFVKLTGGVGTDNYYRTTIDANKQLNDTTAARVNFMMHKNDSPGRDEVWFERWGVAPSLAFGLGTDARLTLSYIHQDSKRVPDRGVPWRRQSVPATQPSIPGAPAPVDKSTYFGWSNIDREEAVVDAFTAVFESDVNDLLKLRNTTRLARTENYSTFAKIAGLICIDGVRFNPTTTGSSPDPVACPATVPGGSNSTLSKTEGPANVRDDVTQVFANTTDLTWAFNTASVEHALVTGFSLSRENFERVGLQARTPANGALTLPVVVDLNNPDPVWSQSFRFFRGGNQVDASVDNVAVYAFDTLKFNEQWQLNAGLRYERNEAEYTTTSITVATGAVASVTPAEANDDLVSGRVGLVYKPVEAGSIYVAYGNSVAPSATSVIAACTSTGTNQNCNLDPEKTTSYEVGTKWDLFDSQLSLSSSVFRNERNSYRVNDSDTTQPQKLDGENFVQGLELGASGKITDQLAVYAGYAFLDSEVEQSVANGAIDAQKGYEVPGTPEHSGNIWTTYLLPGGFELGYGIRYTGSYKTESKPDSETAVIPSSTVHGAMVGYTVNKKLSLRVNVNNLTDETAWNAVRANGNGWGHPGEGRSAVLTVNYTML